MTTPATRRLLAIGSAVILVGGLAVGLMLVWGPAAEPPAASPNPPATADIVRTTLVDRRTFAGTLDYGELSPVGARQSGTLTWLAPVGSVVERGEPLFRVDEQPVVALYGALPMYRPLAEGAEGADVRQLKEELAALGYEGLEADDQFTAATADAVRAWQADLGLAQSGVIEPGQVVFLPGPVRIAEHLARPGDQLDGRGLPLLTVSGTQRQVSLELAIADQALAEVGRAVDVTLPAGIAVEGRIVEVTTVVSSGQGAGAGPGGQGSSGGELRLALIVEIDDQDGLGTLDAAPVEVSLVSVERPDVLAVPLSAVLALADGGYGVEVVDGDSTRVVPISTGMFAGGRVEISGEGLVEGMRVVVPR